ncbi:MAG: serine/threonine protein kinase [Deltaproteobacteria bacterium]|nr:serine/threonine protein kinase [Deltaproteobacteria bacterium]
MGELEQVGRYQLLARLATGGMAEIHLARQTGIGGFEKIVVVKRILPHLAGEKDFVEMFLDEAIIAARLNHPNVVQIYDLGESDGSYYIAMEYLEGESLGHLVSEGYAQNKPMSPLLTAGVTAQICDGLGYAHLLEDDEGKPMGIVHRDISPHNVIVLFSGVAKLVDFGIAKAATKMHQTQVGTLKGKLAYMSPEQCMGKNVDSRSDIFSMGVLLWELLTRQRLFKRDAEPAMIRAIVDEPIPTVREIRDDVPQALAAVADKALQKDPAARFQTAADMATALRDFLREAGADASQQAVKAYALSVLGEQARTKKKLLEQIKKGGASAVSVRKLKPKSGSIPSKGRSGPAAMVDAMAEAATRIRQGEDLDELDDLDKPVSAGGRNWLVLALILLLVGAAAGFGIWWYLNQAQDKGEQGKAVPLVADPKPQPKPEPKSTTAMLSVRSTPEGCEILLDGKALSGRTPVMDLDVSPSSTHKVAVRCEGHEESVQDFLARPGERVALAFVPAPVKAVTPPPIDKPKPKPVIGTRPKPKPKPRPKPKPEPVTATVTKGKLNLNTKPWSEVSLGSRKLGITPLLGLELPVGKHKLTCVNPGRGIKKTVEVQIKEGKTTSLSLKLP